jgi:hypothetical protein
MNWTALRSNPYFVAAWTAFVGALTPQLTSEWQVGHLDWTLAGAEKMFADAAILAAIAVLHLLTPTPGTYPVVTTTTVTTPGTPATSVTTTK